MPEEKRNFVVLTTYEQDTYCCLQKNGYRNVVLYDNKKPEEVMEHLQKTLKGKIITKETATTNSQKELLEEMAEFVNRNYLIARKYETQPYFNPRRRQNRDK